MTILYTQAQTVDPIKIDYFLLPLKLPSNTWNAILWADISEEELNKAISRLKTNKSPVQTVFHPNGRRYLDKNLSLFYYQLLIMFYREESCHPRGEKPLFPLFHKREKQTRPYSL